jgi:hypothetical protein
MDCGLTSEFSPDARVRNWCRIPGVVYAVWVMLLLSASEGWRRERGRGGLSRPGGCPGAAAMGACPTEGSVRLVSRVRGRCVR